MNIVITCCMGDYMKTNVDVIHETIQDAFVIGVDCCYQDYFFVNVDAFEKVPKTLDEGYVDALIGVCKKYDADLIIPTSALDIQVMLKRAGEFPCKIAIGCNDGTAISNDKKLFTEFSIKNGINITKSMVVTNMIQLGAFADDCGGKAFVKYPSGKENLVFDFDSVTRPKFPCIAQKIMTGREFSCVCLCENGKFVHGFVARNDKMAGGTAISATIVHDDRIIAMCKDACEKLKLDGIAEFDLMEDENFDVFIIECNPRITATVSLFVAGGVNVIKMMIDYYMTGSFGDLDFQIREGVSIKRFRHDLFLDENGREMTWMK